MTCFSPLQGFESRDKTSKGKRKTTFSRRNARLFGLFKRVVSCNRCHGCRLQYSREWAVRCMHESEMHKHPDGTSNCSFITLTYNDDFLPRNGSLNYVHWTNFMKRLRRALPDHKIRFYMGAEYGELNARPHYHAIIFGYDFPDRQLYTVRNGHSLFRSDFLESIWSDPKTGRSMGYCSIGDVTFQSAAYVARYMMKKVKGEDYEGRYSRVDLSTGEIVNVEPEKARMSNRSGIGKDWFDLYGRTDIYNKDFVTMSNGIKVRPPKYYDALLERISPQDYEDIKAARQLSMKEFSHEYTPERLRAREVCLLSKTKLLVRNLNSNKENFK